MTDHDSDDDELDDELELEPVDPEILEHQRKRAKRKTRAAEDSVDVNEAFDQAITGDPVDLKQLKNFRFTTRHLLIVTAVASIAMTVFVQFGGCMGLFVSGVVALATGWWFVLREEKRRLAEAEERREQFAQRLAAQRSAEDGETPTPVQEDRMRQISAEWEASEAVPAFKFSFSMKEILGTFAIAAVALTLVQLVGGVQHASLLLGFVALAGLLVQVFGVELPPLVIFGWWVLLVLYILLSLWGAVTSGDEVALAPAGVAELWGHYC